MIDMLAMSATDVRNNWSGVIDSVVRYKPVFIKRTRDYMMLCSTETVAQLVSGIAYIANQIIEDDGSVTLSVDDLGIVVNGETITVAKTILANDILEYAQEYYQDFELYSRAPNRQHHLPYIIKALTAKSPKELEDAIICPNGKI